MESIIGWIFGLAIFSVLSAALHRLGLIVVRAPEPFINSLKLCAIANLAFVIPTVGLFVAMILLAMLTYKKTNVLTVLSAAIVTAITYFGTALGLLFVMVVARLVA